MNASLAREYQVPLSLCFMHGPYSNEHCHPFARFGAKGSAFLQAGEKADPQAAPVFAILERPVGGLGMTVSKDSRKTRHSPMPDDSSVFAKANLDKPTAMLRLYVGFSTALD